MTPRASATRLRLETLHVKARVFETFGVQANTIAGSLGRTVLEYNLLSERLRLKRPSLTTNPQLARALKRISTTWQELRGPDDGMRLLLILPSMGAGVKTLANIRLASELAKDHSVFLCNAQPAECDPRMVEQLDDRVIFLEGVPGHTPWSMAGDRDSGRRTQVLRELVRLHRIDRIHSLAQPADRLALALVRELKLPWLIHLDGYRAIFDRVA